jgi:hypothetical protein
MSVPKLMATRQHSRVKHLAAATEKGVQSASCRQLAHLIDGNPVATNLPANVPGSVI